MSILDYFNIEDRPVMPIELVGALGYGFAANGAMRLNWLREVTSKG